jgi:4a-hydroxytetrahydrobiopterin dehydratase
VTGPITAASFHESAGIEDWRALFGGACAHFRTGRYARSVALVDAIGRLPGVAERRPDIDVRQDGVTVRLGSPESGGLSRIDLALARRISAAARELDASADPAAVQTIQLTIDVLDAAAVMPFWQAVLGYRPLGDEDLVDPHGQGPSLWFQDMDAPRQQRNRIHVDLSLPHDQAEARIAAALAAGGRLVSDEHAPAWWTLADPEGNEVDIATWVGRS